MPFQFFNEDGLERIAGLVGHPKYLHPMTANKTNLEVAKVLTIIDPRKPLPEAVNVQFDSGVISRVLVSSPWMPPVCELCKEIGHASRRCPSLSKSCSHCKSKNHALANCTHKQQKEPTGRKTRRGRSKNKQQWKVVEPNTEVNKTNPAQPTKVVEAHTEAVHMEIVLHSSLGNQKDQAPGETSSTPYYLRPVRHRSVSGASRSTNSEVQPDSSDVESSDTELEEGEFSKHEDDFQVVRNKKIFSGLKGSRA